MLGGPNGCCGAPISQPGASLVRWKMNTSRLLPASYQNRLACCHGTAGVELQNGSALKKHLSSHAALFAVRPKCWFEVSHFHTGGRLWNPEPGSDSNRKEQCLKPLTTWEGYFRGRSSLDIFDTLTLHSVSMNRWLNRCIYGNCKLCLVFYLATKGATVIELSSPFAYLWNYKTYMDLHLWNTVLMAFYSHKDSLAGE